MIGRWKSSYGSIWSRPTVYLSKEDNQRKSARLCARGYEEEPNFRTDSSTFSRKGVDPTCLIIASERWTLMLLGANTLFFAG